MMLPEPVTCPGRCHGDGWYMAEDGPHICGLCEGDGKITVAEYEWYRDVCAKDGHRIPTAADASKR